MFMDAFLSKPGHLPSASEVHKADLADPYEFHTRAQLWLLKGMSRGAIRLRPPPDSAVS